MVLNKVGDPTNHTFILICRRCGTAFCQDGAPEFENPSHKLKLWLEHRLLQAGTPYSVRITDVGCQEVCPENAITIKVVNAVHPEESVHAYTFEPSDDKEELLRELKKHLRTKG
jgi:hypothetical protein